jgi:dTDP-4-amino-4,6-dideoxygalactose transaminase
MTTPPRDPIRFHVSHMPPKAASYVQEALEANENVNGSFTRRVAEHLEATAGIHRVLVTHSATAALEMAAMVLSSVHGAHQVFMPAYTFTSTANAFLRAGYRLEFMDVDPATMDVGMEAVLATGAPANAVVAPIHYAGNPGRIDEIVAWAKERGVWVVEDAAQALGVRLGGTSAGGFGQLGAVSFHFTKNVHSMMGGALYINDPALVETATYIWERGTNRQAMLKGLVDKYSWVDLGSSFQTTELQAALLLAGLEDHDQVIALRRQLWHVYAERLGGLADRGVFTQEWRPDAENNFHAFFVRLESADMADDLRETLAARGVHAYIGYVPLHTSPYGVAHGFARPLPATDRWSACILRLPLHTAMSGEDVHRVVDEIEDWVSRRSG